MFQRDRSLTQWEGEVVAHAQKLSKADHLFGANTICSKDMRAHLVLGLDVVLLHLLQGEPHRVLVVGSHHHPHPLWEGESRTSLNLVSIKHKQGKIVS